MHKKVIKINFMTPLDLLYHVTNIIQYKNVFCEAKRLLCCCKDTGLLQKEQLLKEMPFQDYRIN